MKFLITKELTSNTLLGTLMSAVVIAIILYLALDVFLHAYVIGLEPSVLMTTLYGNAETFEEPLLFDSLLLQVHIDLFMTLFALLILTSIYIRLYEKKTATSTLVHAVFILALGAPLFLIVAHFTSSFFAYLWLASFLLWHIFALFLSFKILKKLFFK